MKKQRSTKKANNQVEMRLYTIKNLLLRDRQLQVQLKD